MSADGTFYYALRTDQSDVYAATLDPVTGEVLVPPERITPRFEGNPLFAPDFSRDGKYLAYTWARGTGARIVVRDLTTGTERSIRLRSPGGNAGVAGYVRWSPDGRSFLMHTGAAISLASVETGEVTWVTRPAPRYASMDKAVDGVTRETIRQNTPGVFERSPQWFPDGKTIVYRRQNTTTNSDHVLMRDLETGREKELYQAPHINSIELSPDGEQLALWTETRGGVLALQVVPVVGGEPRELIRSGLRVYTTRLAWTPDGRHLLLVKRNDDPETQFPHELWRIAVGGGDPESLGLKMEGGLRELRVHPDGRRIVFTSGRNVIELWAAENFLAGKRSANE